jgi:hypothetical protein
MIRFYLSKNNFNLKMVEKYKQIAKYYHQKVNKFI